MESRQTGPLPWNRGKVKGTEIDGHCMETKLQQKQRNKEICNPNSTRGADPEVLPQMSFQWESAYI